MRIIQCERMAQFLDFEAVEEDEEDLEAVSLLEEDCYSEKFSDDDDFIDDSEQPSEEEYRQLIDIVHETVESAFEGIEPKTQHKKYKYSSVKKEEEARMSSKIDKLADKALAKREKKKKEIVVPDSPVTDASDDEEGASMTVKPTPPAPKKPSKQKRPVVVEEPDPPSDVDDGGHDDSFEIERREIEEASAAAADMDEEDDGFDPSVFNFNAPIGGGTNDDMDSMFFNNEPEIDLTNPDAKVEVKCGICERMLNQGWSEKTNSPYLYCPDKENCHFAWMSFDRAIQFHQVAPNIIASAYRAPFRHGRPRCECGQTMMYRWVEKASEERSIYLVGGVFLECCVPKKEGGPCSLVIYVGKCDTKAERTEMTKLYAEEKAEYLRKKEEADLQIKMKLREMQRDKKLRTGVFTATIRGNMNANKALKERLARMKALKKQFAAPKK